MLLVCIIGAKQERDAAVINVLNDFIQTRIENEKDMAIIKICRMLMDMLLDIAPDVYEPHVTTGRKLIKQLITKCMNVIYGTMVESLLDYCKFCNTLKLNKFKLNTYDTYVANKMVNELQQSILFHVNDCKFIHK